MLEISGSFHKKLKNSAANYHYRCDRFRNYSYSLALESTKSPANFTEEK